MKKQEDRKDWINEGTISSLRHFLCRKEMNSKELLEHSVTWLQEMTFQPGTKSKKQQEWSKQPRDWGYRN